MTELRVAQAVSSVRVDEAHGAGVPVNAHHGWIGSLRWEDLQRLRLAVRKAWAVTHPDEPLTDRECDRMIDAHGPVVMEKRLKRAIDRQQL